MLRLGRHLERLASPASRSMVQIQAGLTPAAGYTLPTTLQRVMKSSQAATVQTEYSPIKKLLVANRGM